MADNARGTHSAPGVYTREIEVAKNKKSLGITSLGLVGETLKGRAFEPTLITDWKEFKENFGGKSVEKFKGSKFPKYELPYIAESYIEQSQQLQIVRVLGLSGYNAGPAWLIVDNNKKVIAVLRSRGEYEKFHKYVPTLATDCKCGGSVYDHLRYFVGEWDDESYDCTIPSYYNMDALKIGQYVSLENSGNECAGYTINGKAVGLSVNSNNYGVFSLYGTTSEGHYLTIEDVNRQGLPTGDIRDYCNTDSKYFLLNEGGERLVVYADENGEYLWTMTAEEQIAKGIQDEAVGYEYEDGSILIGRNGRDGLAYFTNSVNHSVGKFQYGVSLNPADKNYILNVIGTKADNGSAPIFCESLYDVSLLNGINEGTTTEISSQLVPYNVYNSYDYCGLKSVIKFVPLAEEALTKKYVGNRYLIDEYTPINVHPYNYNTNKPYSVEPLLGEDNTVTAYTCVISDGYSESAVTPTEETFNFALCQDGSDYDGLYICRVGEQPSDTSGETLSSGVNFPQGTILFVDTKTNTICVKGSDLIGQVVVVKQYTLSGVRHYFYTYYSQGSVYGAMVDKNSGEYKGNVIPLLDRLNYIDNILQRQDSNNNIYKSGMVKVQEDGYYYRLMENGDGKKSIVRVTIDINDYKSAYRFASTPWIVSNAKGDRTHIDLHKLFRFHTISDGDTANEMFKVSIFNIRPDEGTFSVGIRDINDTDASPIYLEKFSNVNLTPTSRNYIAYKIGSFDGTYESKSKYVTIEVNEDDATRLSVPCGFVGYPINFYNGYQVVGDYAETVVAPTIPYNTEYYNELKEKKQYFGCSDLAGVDIDVFSFKGDKYYNENDPSILSNGFHLDCRVNPESYTDEMNIKITVDGVEGYTFTTVNSQTRTEDKPSAPIIATEQDMEDTIYSNVDLRKFTCYFYGGFDGWDVYREERTNGDEFTRTNYKGKVSTVNDEGVNFKGLADSVALGLNGACITSDYYAYLAGYRQLANPSRVDINLLATPGIDYVNQNLLVKDVVEMIEEERKDTLYIVTTPDKAEGADDTEESMFTAEEIVENLEDSQINSSYVATYYPWVKFLDTSNNTYIFLPPTKDVVRNMAQTDNQQFEWFAPAGKDRGPVDCVKAKKITKLAEEDTLYDGRINYLRTFAKDGVRVWGQKTLYSSDDDKAPLTRIGVRRLMLAIRRRLVNACMSLIFDPNDSQEKEKADSLIRPIMQDIKKNRGCVDFAIEYDTSDEARDRLELPIKVWVKPTLQLEYVPIDFMITAQDADFSDLG